MTGEGAGMTGEGAGMTEGACGVWGRERGLGISTARYPRRSAGMTDLGAGAADLSRAGVADLFRAGVADLFRAEVTELSRAGVTELFCAGAAEEGAEGGAQGMRLDRRLANSSTSLRDCSTASSGIQPS